MEILNSIFDFFTDKTKKLPHKVILFLVASVLIIMLDNFLSFTYSYNNRNKIEQIDGINKILKDSTLSKLEKKKLITLRKDIINHCTLKDKTYDFLSTIDVQNDFQNETKNRKKPKKIESKNEVNKTQSTVKSRDYFWHFISSNCFFILIMIILPVAGFLEKNTPLWKIVAILTFVETILYGICLIYAKLLSFIPIIFNNPIFNYILNAIICLSSILLFNYINKKKK